MRINKVYSAYQKSLHCLKVPHVNISRYFQKMFIHVDSYYVSYIKWYQNIWWYCMLEWAGATFVKLSKIQAWQELLFVLSATSNIESREKASTLSFWWSDDNYLWKNIHCCVYILTYAIDILCCIELLITLLSVLVTFWCFTALIITALIIEHTKK